MFREAHSILSKRGPGRRQYRPGQGVTTLFLVRAPIVLATIAWAIGEALMRRSPRSDRLARVSWTVGVVLTLLHVVLAFDLTYAWDHEAAVQATVSQTLALVGWGWRGSIYINYLFLAIWTADACWWWLAPASHATRARWIEMTRLALFTFMFFNGAVIFASGFGRAIGTISIAVVLLTSIASRRLA